MESSYIIHAQRLLNGGLIYQDVWETKPPLTLYFYKLFLHLFGSYALTAIRIFACIYIFLSACLLDRLISGYRQSSEATVLPAFLYGLLISVPWHFQEVTPELLLTLPTLLCFSWLTDYIIEEKHHWSLLFGIGMMLGVCIGIKWQGFWVVGSILVSYVLVARPLLKDLTTMFGGFMLVLLFLFLPLYFQSGLSEFWDLAVVYTYDHYRFDVFNGQLTDRYSLLDLLRIYGVFLLLTLFGFLAIKGKAATTIKLRKIEVVMNVWLVAAAVCIILSGKFFYLPYLYFGLPVIIYYGTGYVGGKQRSWFRKLILFGGYLFPAYTYLLFIMCIDPVRYEFIRLYESKDYWIGLMWSKVNLSPQEKLLARDINRQKISNGIFIAYYQPEWYLRLNQPCASRYGDFAAAYNKIDWLKHNFLHSSLLSQPEDMARVYETFRIEQPDYVIDPYGIFTEIKAHLPILLEPYAMKKVGYYKVYYRRTNDDLVP